MQGKQKQHHQYHCHQREHRKMPYYTNRRLQPLRRIVDACVRSATGGWRTFALATPPCLIPGCVEMSSEMPLLAHRIWIGAISGQVTLTLWICRKAIIRKNVCAETVKSSRCCLVSVTSASCGSFSHGSIRPGPLIRMPVEMPSMTRRKQSPGLNGMPADEMIFSVNSSRA